MITKKILYFLLFFFCMIGNIHAMKSLKKFRRTAHIHIFIDGNAQKTTNITFENGKHHILVTENHDADLIAQDLNNSALKVELTLNLKAKFSETKKESL